MQTTTPLTSTPASYSWFDAPQAYQDTHREVPKAKNISLPPTTAVNTNPGGSTVIQTETPTKHAAGFMAKVENLGHRVQEHLGFGTDTATRWSLYQINEPLLGEFPAKVVNGIQGRASGYMFVSQGHLCFSSFTNAQNRAIKVIIPLSNIVHIGLAQRVKNSAHASGIVLAPLSSLSMKANALQVVTSDNVNHQFFGFRKNTENVFNLLNHTWQSSRGMAPSSLPTTGAPLQGSMADRNHNGIPDSMERNQFGGLNDRNHNGIPDSQERLGGLNDRNMNGIPDNLERTGTYTTTGLVDSYQGSGLQGTTHYVNGTTSLTKEVPLSGTAPMSTLPQGSRLQ